VSPATTRITLLGRTAIERDGTAVATVSGRRAELVFAYLAIERHRSVSRDELANALWPDVLPDTWNAALRGVLTDVRRTFERAGFVASEVLLTEQGRVRLELPEATTIDVEEAQAALASARTQLDGGAASAAATRASQAADATEGTFLPFHDDGWAADVRARLESLHIDALRLAGQAALAAGEPQSALAAADRLVRADPFLEAGHRLRIESLGELGDRAGALRAFERCKALLEAELGIEPSSDTAEALRRAVEGQAPAAEAPAAPLVSRYAGYSVLVVEDHDFQRRTTLTLLRGLGVGTLHEAADGAAALSRLDGASAPDVIVCDIDMPGMDGVEFIRHVAERRLASAVVIASGLDGRVLETVRAASQGYGLQVLGAVAKPLTTASLERMLATYRPEQADAQPAALPASGSVGELLDAVADGSLRVEFEPIVDLAVGEVAALRARLPTSCAELLPRAADAAGLGRTLVERMLQQTSAAAGAIGAGAVVELTPGVLTDVTLADALGAITREGVVLVAAAHALAAQQSAAMLDVLARLRIKGYGLCVDGPGGDGVDRYPLTQIALPAPLLAQAATTGDLSALEPAIEASRRLGVPLIGRCDTGEEFELLLRLGCSYACGRFVDGTLPSAAGEAAAPLDWIAPPVAAQLR
jgi:DNA-binding SARP family transcriptional activator/CheY-like chemotaxis protein